MLPREAVEISTRGPTTRRVATHPTHASLGRGGGSSEANEVCVDLLPHQASNLWWLAYEALVVHFRDVLKLLASATDTLYAESLSLEPGIYSTRHMKGFRNTLRQKCLTVLYYRVPRGEHMFEGPFCHSVLNQGEPKPWTPKNVPKP